MGSSKAEFDTVTVELAPEGETGSRVSVSLAGVGSVEEHSLFFECGRPSGLFDGLELRDIDLFAIRADSLHRPAGG